MELYSLQVFLAVATEKSFSRAAEKLLRTQPAVSLSLQRLEQELGEKLIDRSGKDLILTDAGRTVLEYARRFQSLRPGKMPWDQLPQSTEQVMHERAFFGAAPDVPSVVSLPAGKSVIDENDFIIRIMQSEERIEAGL